MADLSALYSHDGDTEASTLKDDEAETLRGRCLREFDALRGSHPGEAGELDLFLTRLVRDYILSEQAISEGSTLIDAIHFINWLRDSMSCFRWVAVEESSSLEPDPPR